MFKANEIVNIPNNREIAEISNQEISDKLNLG
jgi:hypothetical protein